MPAIDRQTARTAVFFLLLSSPALTQELDVSDFERWDTRSFSGETIYSFDRQDSAADLRADGLSTDGINATVLTANAAGTASAFYRAGRIDLAATPCLSWAWRIDSTAPASLNELNKNGDDYAARVYVVRRGGLAFWRAKTINYVWSANQAAGSRWPNAYAGANAQMWALNSGNSQARQWQWHSRDIVADWQLAFGEEISSLDGIAIMTDGDDSGSQLSAAYATLRFSARSSEGQCVQNSENTL